MRPRASGPAGTSRSRRRRVGTRTLVAPLCGALLALVAAACGVDVQASPTVVNPKQVPFGLLHRSTPTTAPARSGQYVTIYLVGSEHLVAVSRDVPTPVTAAGILHALGTGPTPEEASEGLRSPISTAVPLTLWQLATTTITVNVAGSFTTLAGQDQAEAAAQLVYTLTSLPGITSVGIRIDGKSATVPTAKGTLSAGPLDRGDYETLAPI
ncbi:MAG: GerMN domain-containing protein [Actinomycetota bacterium]|nr:GerMN domain-containing protein [Actinomycetota bacterium]